MLNNIITLIWREKNTKLVIRSELITYQSKAIENLNIFDIKLFIKKHLKTLHK